MPIRKTLWLVVLASGVSSSASPQPPTSTVRTPQFENDSVRVWKTTIATGQPLTMHRHESGRVIVALTDGTLRIVKESGESRTVIWERGNAYWLPADPPGEKHGDLNEGQDPIEVMVVELKPRTPLGEASPSIGNGPARGR
jgi:quercetin dioxygenase-like cupin family protein